MISMFHKRKVAAAAPAQKVETPDIASVHAELANEKMKMALEVCDEGLFVTRKVRVAAKRVSQVIEEMNLPEPLPAKK